MSTDRFTSIKSLSIGNTANNASTYSTNAKAKYGGVFGDNLAFPIELGNAGEGSHYMVFYINELLGGKYDSSIKSRLSKDDPVFQQKNSSSAYNILNVNQNAQLEAEKKKATESTYTTTKEGAIEKIKDYNPQYARTSVCIALPMPELLNTAFDAQWNTVDSKRLNTISLGLDAIQGLQSTGGDPNGVVKEGQRLGNDAAARGVSRVASRVLAGDAGNILTKTIQNPRKEMAFDSIINRRFSFQWTLYPRSAEESKRVWDIIQMFKYHMLPEHTMAGFFIDFPNTFDIEIHSNGKRNNWLPKTSTCALQRMDLNYTPGGTYAFFKEDDLLKAKGYPDGAPPVGVTIAVEFVELELMYRNRIDPDGNFTFAQGQGPTKGTF